MRTKKIIDLLKYTEMDTVLLKKLFENLKHGDILEKDNPHLVCNSGNEIEVSLSHSVFCRERHSRKTPDKPKEGLRYEVMGEPLGNGAFATVFDVMATLILLPNGNIEVRKKPRVLKVNDSGTVYYSNINGDLYGSHLHAKPAIPNNEKYYSVMRKMPGETLDRLFQDGTISRLSPSKKLTLCSALLNALKIQVYDKGLVHNDMKSANIMVELGSNPKVNIIDFGLSEPSTQKYSRFCHNSLLYGAPETLYERKNHPNTDMYSMAKIFNFVYQGKQHVLTEDERETWDNLCRSQKFDYSNKLGMKDLDNQELNSLIEKMMRKDPNQRISMTDAIKEIDNNILKISPSKTPPSLFFKSSSVVSSPIEINCQKSHSEFASHSLD